MYQQFEIFVFIRYKPELNHQMLCLFFIAGEYFIKEIQNKMDL